MRALAYVLGFAVGALSMVELYEGRRDVTALGLGGSLAALVLYAASDAMSEA